MSFLWVPGMLTAIYLLIYLWLPQIPISAQIRTYVFQPVFWLLLLLATRFLPPYRTLGRGSRQGTFIWLALFIAFLQIVLYAIGGLFSGFGKNPASFTAIGILGNLFYVGMMLVGMEISRAFLITLFSQKHRFLAIGLVSLLYTLIAIPLSQFLSFSLDIQSADLIMSSWLPLLAENLLASLLVLIAGPRASLAYRGLLAAFWWFCPVLPDLNWVFKGLFGAVIPILGIILVNSYYTHQAVRGQPKRVIKKTALQSGWIITALVCVVIVWFAIGVFPFQPQLVGSGSMNPALQTGDIVIVAKMPADKIRLGDIVQYRKDENTTIIHRVVAFDQTGGYKTFITKGDSNSSVDENPVLPDNIIGKVVFNLPKVGILSIIIKNIFSGGT
jgi:signal peptidase I